MSNQNNSLNTVTLLEQQCNPTKNTTYNLYVLGFASSTQPTNILSNLQRLKKERWGNKLLADTEKLLENPQIKILLSQTVEEEKSKEEKIDGDSNFNQL